jgi:hypothetical protein
MNYGFDLPTIKYLRDLSESSEKSDKDWYAASYMSTIDLLKDRKKNNLVYSEVDLKLAISIAYSWMPRIPNIVVENWGELTKDINNLGSQYSIDERVFVSTLKKCVKQIDNSVIGFSKVLHFLFPDKYAILDNRVKLSWNKLFPNNKLSYKLSVDDFIKYQKNINLWSKNTSVQLRDLESLLFIYSKTL